MSIEEIRAEYEQIKRSWHGASAAERDENVQRLTELAQAAERTAESGAEYLQMEIEDLIDDIRKHSTHI
jgi:uncharacterized protein YukE